NWNGWRDTLKAYQSLQFTHTAEWEMIIVDNASTDDSIQHLRQLPKPVTLIENTANEGFAKACNTGMKAALARGSEYVFLLNNDACVRSDTLSVLEQNASAVGDAILGCVVRYRESGKLQF